MYCPFPIKVCLLFGWLCLHSSIQCKGIALYEKFMIRVQITRILIYNITTILQFRCMNSLLSTNIYELKHPISVKLVSWFGSHRQSRYLQSPCLRCMKILQFSVRNEMRVHKIISFKNGIDGVKELMALATFVTRLINCETVSSSPFPCCNYIADKIGPY